MSPTQAWEAILKAGRQHLGMAIVELWIEQGTPLEVDGDELLVLAYDPMHFAWIERRYGGWLGHQARELGLAGVRLRRVEKAQLRDELRAVAA